jgi:hypothetical protein
MLTFEAKLAPPATETRSFLSLESTAFPTPVLIDGFSDLP